MNDKQPVDRPRNSKPASEAASRGQKSNWLFAFGGALVALVAVLLVALATNNLSTPADKAISESQPGILIPPGPTPRAAATPSSTPTSQVNLPILPAQTAVPTPVAGGQVLILESGRGDTGWVTSDIENLDAAYTPPNQFGDSFLYAGILDAKVFNAAFQFDLSLIPRGTKIYGASVRLTGLRADLLDVTGNGRWQLQLLAPGADANWRNLNFEQIHNASTISAFGPPLTQTQLGEGQINIFEFSLEQLELLERHILENNNRISFRLDGPKTGDDNIFAWDSGSGPASQGIGPELFLNLGPAPLDTPAPNYFNITSTPTPDNLITAAAISARMTSEATRIGTATSIPANWATPVVVTVTPTPENRATAQIMNQQATAIALTTGVPPNIVTATPTPTFVIITGTPTPYNVLTAAAEAIQLTAAATRIGTATRLPANWVTPVVVTSTPSPQNAATAQYWRAEATAAVLAYGTSTPAPPNLFTATPTPIYVVITSAPTPENVLTAAAVSVRITAEAGVNGTATSLPPNWVTPLVVTSSPTPANAATVEYLKAIALTTGTPTPTPSNMQTATPTPILVTVPLFPSATATATPSPTAQTIPIALVGKIIFLSDREGATEEERLRADKAQATPRALVQPYVYDPTSGQLSKLPESWPYKIAEARDTWSADERYRVFTKDAVRNSKFVPALYVYDYFYSVEQQLTHFGAGIAYNGVWSPTSSQIAFVSNDTKDDEIWVIDADGLNLLRLTSTNEAYNAREIGKDTFIAEVNHHPSWSPDGEQIIFTSNRSGTFQIWIMNKDGTEQRLLMDANPYNDWDPVWIKTSDPPPPVVR